MREDVLVVQTIDLAQLENIRAKLDLTLLALEALAGIGSDAVLRVAAKLGQAETIGDRVTLWRLRQSSPLRNGQGGRKKLDVEEARSLVLVVCALAREHHELIRRAMALLEQYDAIDRPPHEAGLLGDYLDRFTDAYQERMIDGDRVSPQVLEQLALKLLVDLLFYSGPEGARRLWLALFDREVAQMLPQNAEATFPRPRDAFCDRGSDTPRSRDKRGKPPSRNLPRSQRPSELDLP